MNKLQYMMERLVSAMEKDSRIGDPRGEVGGGDWGESGSYAQTKSSKGSEWTKVDIPIFEGEDAFRSIRKLVRYFWSRRIREEEKMEAVMVSLEGDALSWFQWWETCYSNQILGRIQDCLDWEVSTSLDEWSFSVSSNLETRGQWLNWSPNFNG